MIVTLIGFMGSGKTTLGKKLANRLGVTLMDLDKFIEKQERMNIAQIFEEKGENGFRELERKWLEHILNAQNDIVLSVGGGTPCFNDNLSLLKEKTTIVYLKMSEKQLFNRLKNANNIHRPLLKGKSDEELEKFIEESLIDRSTYYEQAHLIFDGFDISSERIDQLVEQLNRDR